MIIIFENVGLQAAAHAAIDKKLRQRFPTLVAWTYNYSEDALALTFPDSEAEKIIDDKVSSVESDLKRDYSQVRFRGAVLKGVLEWAR